MALSVIGAGFGRTGTDSMRNALNLLGVGPCYHMYEVMPHQERVDTWRAVARGEPADWDAIFADYGATVDWPAARYWRDLSAHYPNARILLTTRDADSWYASMDKTILEVLRTSTQPDSIASNLVGQGVFGGRFNDRDHVIDTFNRNTADVQAAFDDDRLLTFNIGDGWAPLCAFLGCEVPDVPFPHTNKPADFHAAVDKVEGEREAAGD